MEEEEEVGLEVLPDFDRTTGPKMSARAKDGNATEYRGGFCHHCVDHVNNICSRRGKKHISAAGGA